MSALTLRGAEVLWPDGLSAGDLCYSDGILVPDTVAKAVDLSGHRILPGIVDAHGDGFERHLAPRRGAMRDLSAGLQSTVAELASNGITTAVLAQFWSWEGGMRSPEFALRFLAALQAFDAGGTDLRKQIRFETHLIEQYDELQDAVTRFGVDYVVFNDHLPHAALARGKRPPRLTGQALKSGRSPDAHLALLQQLHAGRDKVPAAIADLAARLAGQGVLLGSHDDATADARGFWQGIGADVSEFPETQAAAIEAHKTKGAVVMGAPNVVRGGSHSGHISAAELVKDGLCNALASDYHYPAPRQAALMLAEMVGISKAWALVSSGPAQVLRLTDRGEIRPGLRADLVILDEGNRVGATIAGGRITYLAGETAQRFIA